MSKKMTFYLAGPITGVERYWEPFEAVADDLTSRGHCVLSTHTLPHVLTNAQYMRSSLALIDASDVVLFLPGWRNSAGARLELDYCEYISKPTRTLFAVDVAEQFSLHSILDSLLAALEEEVSP